MKADTISKLFLERISKTPDNNSHSYIENKKWVTLSWREFKKRVENMSFALKGLGVKRGDKIAFISEQRIEYLTSDIASSLLGAVVVPIYPEASLTDIQHIVSKTQVSYLFIEDGHQLKKISSFYKKLKSIKKIILLSRNNYVTHFGTFDKFHSNLIHYSDLDAIGEKEKNSSQKTFEEIVENVGAEDLYTIAFTSGVLSLPKAVSVTNSMIVNGARKILERVNLDSYDVFHPTSSLASVLGRYEMVLSLLVGSHTYLGYNAHKNTYFTGNKKPTVLFSNSKSLLDAFYSIHNNINKKYPFRHRIMKKTLKIVMNLKKDLRFNFLEKFFNRFMYFFLRILFMIGFVRVFGRRLRFIIIEGIDVNDVVKEFYAALGIPVVPTYVLVETFSIVAMGRAEKFNTNIKLEILSGIRCEARDGGNIYLAGDNIFHGYFGNQQLNEKFFIDGFLETGDVGTFNNNVLEIYGKSETRIRVSEEEYLYPEKMEPLFSFSRYIERVFIVGQYKPYLTALITLNREMIIRYARTRGIYFSDYASLCENEFINELVSKRVKNNNSKIKPAYRIKVFKILSTSFSPETEDLTPSLKIKRQHCLQKYSKAIQKMYE